MDNLMDKIALERLQAELIQRRDKLQAETNTIGLFPPSELKVLKSDLQVTCYFIDQIDAELEYVERQLGTYANPFIGNYSAKSGIDAANKDSIRDALQNAGIDKNTLTTDNADNDNIGLVDIIDFETGQG